MVYDKNNTTSPPHGTSSTNLERPTKKDIDAATEARWNAQVKSRLSDSGKLVVLGSRERDPLHTVPTREGGPRQH